MALADILKKKGLTNYSFTSSVAKTPKRKSPRETLISQLDSNLQALNNPNFRVKNRKGENIRPEACYKVEGDNAIVWASYSKKRITLDGNDSLVVVPAKMVKECIEAIIENAESGAYDDQLMAIQGARSSSQKGKTRKKSS